MRVNIYVAALAAVCLAGCGQRQQAAADPHQGHNHDESLQITSYSDNYELYIEATPLATGHDCDLRVRITRLSDFKPLAGASVKATLEIGETLTEAGEFKMTAPGIYFAGMKPAVAGGGRLRFDITSDGVSQTAYATGIRVLKDLHKAQHYAADMAVEPGSNDVVFPKEQSWKVDFATEEAHEGPFGEVIKATAQILPAQGDEAVVAARAGGIVTFPKGILAEGVAVRAGQELFSISSDGMLDNNLGVRYNEAASEYRRTKADYERKRELANDKIVSESELQRAEADYKAAEARYDNLRRNFSGGKYSVKSPIGGFVREVRVRSGEFAEAGQAVVVVSRNRDLMVRAEVAPKYYPSLSKISTANFRIPGSGHTYTLKELGGRVVSYGRSTDAANPQIPVLFSVANKGDLLPGSFIEVYIHTDSDKEVVNVPNGALVEEMGSYFVFVQVTPEIFEKRAVTKGVTDGLRTEIASGLAGGERVVSRGAIFVKLAQGSATLDPHAGHVH